MKSADLTILFLSCDKYSDLWEPLFYSVRKFWKHCPYPMRLGSNTISFQDSKIQTLLSGPDIDWSSSLRAILKKISTPYVFIWLDDMFPIKNVRSEDISQTVDFMIRHDAKHVHMEPTPKPDTVTSDGKYGIYDRGAPYRTIVFGFWNVRYLSDLLLTGENPWNFEIMGSYRSRYTDGFFCAMQPVYTRLHVVAKGKIFQSAYKYLQRHSIPVSTMKHPVMSNLENLQRVLQIRYFDSFVQFPWKIRLAIMDALRKILITY